MLRRSAPFIQRDPKSQETNFISAEPLLTPRFSTVSCTGPREQQLVGNFDKLSLN